MKTILLVRHAESENNAAHERVARTTGRELKSLEAKATLARHPDAGLTTKGQRQAECLARALAARFDSAGCLLVSSPMRRALETAAPVAAAMGLDRRRFQCHGELYEVGGCWDDQGALPGRRPAEIEAELPLVCHPMYPEGWFAGREAKETTEEARARVLRLRDWAEGLLGSPTCGFDTLILVMHGELLTRWLRLWLGVPWHRDVIFVHGNTGISELVWRPTAGVMLGSTNRIEHLPEDLRSGQGHGEGWWLYTSPDLEIRRLVDAKADAEEDLALHRRLGELRQKHLLEPEGKFPEDYHSIDRRSVAFVAVVEGRPAGFVQFDPDSCRLRQLVVDPGFRGRRLGSRLVGAVAQEAKRHGQTTLLVNAWTKSASFYARTGFVSAGDEVDARPIPWVPMEMALDE